LTYISVSSHDIYKSQQFKGRVSPETEFYLRAYKIESGFSVAQRMAIDFFCFVILQFPGIKKMVLKVQLL
jgi:hypothetical protein